MEQQEPTAKSMQSGVLKKKDRLGDEKGRPKAFSMLWNDLLSCQKKKKKKKGEAKSSELTHHLYI